MKAVESACMMDEYADFSGIGLRYGLSDEAIWFRVAVEERTVLAQDNKGSHIEDRESLDHV